MPRTGTAQWQDLGDVSCDATQVPMIQKVQKTVEILQVQFIDKVVENSEIMQSKRQAPEIQKERKLEEVPRQNCGRSSRAEEAVPAKYSSPCSNPNDRCQGCNDAERDERQSTSKSDAKCKDKIHEKES